MKELFEIYDGSAEAKKAKGKSKNLSGFHPLFTAAARRSIALDSLKIWLLLGFIVGVVTGVATGAGVVSVLLGLLIAAVIYFGFRDDVYKKVYGPEHDRGHLPLPEGMSWEEAVDRIRRGFANPDVEQVTDTADAMTFYSKAWHLSAEKHSRWPENDHPGQTVQKQQEGISVCSFQQRSAVAGDRHPVP